MNSIKTPHTSINRLGLALVLLVLVLLPIASPVLSNNVVTNALSSGDKTLLIKRLVVVQLDEDGKPVLNVTVLNKVLNLTANASVSSARCNATANTTAKLNVSVQNIYVLNKTNEKMVFAKIALYNTTYNYSFYVLAYWVHHSSYNITIVTRILTDPQTGNFTIFSTLVNVEPREKHPVADIILVSNDTTLSQYYKVLAKTLEKVGPKDNDTKAIWPKAAEDLEHLSKLVEKHLGQWDKQRAKGIALVMDFDAGCCFRGIISLIMCIKDSPSLIRICPLCAQVITCIPACTTVFTVWTCILCIGTGLFACAACAYGVYSCVSAANDVLNCCR